MDVSRRQDLSRDDAMQRCQELGTNLVTVETEEEFDFIRREIRSRVTSAGQEFAHEQWWTAGRISGNRWIWDGEYSLPGRLPGRVFLISCSFLRETSGAGALSTKCRLFQVIYTPIPPEFCDRMALQSRFRSFGIHSVL